MTERVFRDGRVSDMEWVFRGDAVNFRAIGDPREDRSKYTQQQILKDRNFREVTSRPTDLPPTTADLNNKLDAYKQFATAITASFGDDAKRSHQLDFQAAYDRLHKSIQPKGT